MIGPRTSYRDENVSSPVLPGGNLIAASLDRQVMVWSDRGGASRHIGDRWAIRCSEALGQVVGETWPVPGDGSYVVSEVVRLDDVPEVSREANRHHLENPDFLLLGSRSDGSPVLQAADAKFAADRIKPSQVSADVVNNLLALTGGTAGALIDATVNRLGIGKPAVVRGVFIAPHSTLTAVLLRQVTAGRNPSVDPDEVVTIDPSPGTMFAGLPESRAIGPLARIDALPVTPRDNLISAIYYFRLACACFYLWNEEHRPLLSNQPWSDPEPGIVTATIAHRSQGTSSAYELVAGWAVDIEPQVRARESIRDIATLPIRMRDLRSAVESAGLGADGRVLRGIRRDLELAFRDRLFDEIGEISADDPRPLPKILDSVASLSRSLTGEMTTRMNERVAAAREERDMQGVRIADVT